MKEITWIRLDYAIPYDAGPKIYMKTVSAIVSYMCVESIQSIQYTIQHSEQSATAQHNTVQHNTTQHNTTQHNATQHNTMQRNTIQHNTVHYSTECSNAIPLFLAMQDMCKAIL